MHKALPGYPFAVEQRYNSQGHRGGEFPAPRPGVRRVVIIGDSFNQGWGVEESHQYTVWLEHLLNASGHGRWQVLNASLHAADFPRLWFLFRKALQHDPDIVLYGMTMTDTSRHGRMRGPSGGAVSRQLNQPPWSWLARVSRLAALVKARYAAYLGEQARIRWELDLFGRPNLHGWRQTKKYLQRMNRTMNERGGRFLLMMWPRLISLDDGYPLRQVHTTVAEFCQRRDVPFHDLMPVLAQRPTPSLWVHPRDRHPNEVAHRLVAESLVEVILGL
jgi:lysophospholipase L1-like esterase